MTLDQAVAQALAPSKARPQQWVPPALPELRLARDNNAARRSKQEACGATYYRGCHGCLGVRTSGIRCRGQSRRVAVSTRRPLVLWCVWRSDRPSLASILR
jgi:hypothetical protein